MKHIWEVVGRNKRKLLDKDKDKSKSFKRHKTGEYRFCNLTGSPVDNCNFVMVARWVSRFVFLGFLNIDDIYLTICCLSFQQNQVVQVWRVLGELVQVRRMNLLQELERVFTGRAQKPYIYISRCLIYIYIYMLLGDLTSALGFWAVSFTLDIQLL
jgi:hypothetical protein